MTLEIVDPADPAARTDPTAQTAGRVRPPLVIGVGHRDRADDGIGPSVAVAIGERTAEVSVIVREGDLAVLPLLWEDYDDVVIVDGCRNDRPIGSLTEIDPECLTAGVPMSTHGFGVADALTLARLLGRMPSRIRLFGITGRDFGYGPMSPELARAIPGLVDQLMQEMGSEVSDDPPRRS